MLAVAYFAKKRTAQTHFHNTKAIDEYGLFLFNVLTFFFLVPSLPALRLVQTQGEFLQGVLGYGT